MTIQGLIVMLLSLLLENSSEVLLSVICKMSPQALSEVMVLVAFCLRLSCATVFIKTSCYCLVWSKKCNKPYQGCCRF